VTAIAYTLAAMIGGAYAAVLGTDPVTAHDLAVPFTIGELMLWAFVAWRVERS
jgi:hypothetical protein